MKNDLFNSASKPIEVYTDSNPNMACIAIEKPEKNTENERRFELIVVENKCQNFFEADAVRIALEYLPKNSRSILYCDKEGDIKAIKSGKSNNNELNKIIENIKFLEKERNLIVTYEYKPRKNNYAGRMLDNI